jgi:hypothetical protein
MTGTFSFLAALSLLGKLLFVFFAPLPVCLGAISGLSVVYNIPIKTSWRACIPVYVGFFCLSFTAVFSETTYNLRPLFLTCVYVWSSLCVLFGLSLMVSMIYKKFRRDEAD